jgi:hypothetical protein
MRVLPLCLVLCLLALASVTPDLLAQSSSSVKRDLTWLSPRDEIDTARFSPDGTFVVLAEQLPPEQALDAKLRETVASYDLGRCTFPQALVRISNDFRVPMGIVWIDTEGTQLRPACKWEKSTVRDVIESAVQTQPGYKMQVTDGVVHVFPAELSGGKENFLTVKLKAFSVHNTYLEIASRKLHDLIAPPSYAAGSVGASIEQKVTVDLENCTVQDVLDALVYISTRKIWLVTFLKDPGLTPAGFRRSRSVWSTAPAPDKEQPVWDLLRWSDQLPQDTSSNAR